MSRREAFTLVEIMIVVAIIALLAAVAVPSMLRARERTRNAKFANAVRIADGAFETYAAEHGTYPLDVARGVLPAGMKTYFGDKLDWTAPTPIGGNWDWDANVFGFKAGVSVVAPNLSDAQMTVIDEEIDDGVLASGSFRATAAARYTSILE